MTDHLEQKAFVLGIDLGSNSVGWALIHVEDGEPAGIFRAGARVFDAGMEGDIESGREESRNLKRRQMRLQRRQLWRRRRRMEKICRLLQRFNLLPSQKVSTPAERQDFFNRLDQTIIESQWFKAKQDGNSVPEPHHVLPYLLRTAALDEPLEPYHLGRALYHLAQRRGFLSNRKQTSGAKKKDDDEGVVKEGIAQLRKEMKEKQARTLGEYFASLDPSQHRIRGRWTARSMYEDEFHKLWDAQAKHHPALLTEERKKLVSRAIFHQRPLRIQRFLIGDCELEPDRRRAPAYLLSSQRFRLLQKVNDFKVFPPNEAERFLTPEERARQIHELETKGDLTFPAIRKLFGMPKTCQFNLQEGGEVKIPGNRTASQFCEVFGTRWAQMSFQERDQAVEYVNGFQKQDKLKEAAQKRWGFSDSDAERFSGTSLEPDYMNLSRRAMENLLPLLEQGMPYATARKQLYPEKFVAKEPLPLLPPLERAEGIGELRNPAVTRSLTELRKVVNAILRTFGKPAEIRIELARDLRNTKKQREAMSLRNRDNQKARIKAAEKILEEVRLAQPSRTDIRKVLLAEECGWKCPYTGRSISMHALAGPESQFDIEHIIPLSRSLDDSFANVTLCYNEENRNVKHNKTPWEAYGGDAAKFEEILQRVKQFHGNFAKEKLRRFQMTETDVADFFADFSARQLNDTRYASKLAADYLSLLYGGRSDAGGTLRIRSSAGRVTADLRNEWGLNVILRDGSTSNGGAVPKSREDYRHHAVDAVVIALTDDGTIRKLSRAAERAPLEHRRRFGSVQGPWPNFVDTVRTEIDRIVVSHRVSKKVSGALHEETIYSPPISERGPDGKPNGEAVPHVRKPLSAITKGEIEDIADSVVRRKVHEKLQELGGGDPKKLFAIEANLPFFIARDGRHIPIKRVRVRVAERPMPLGSGVSQRYVMSGSNHHLEVFAYLDEQENETEWNGIVVSMFEAYRRKKLGLPTVNKIHGPEARFKFSLSTGEIVECNVGPSERGRFAFRKVSKQSSGGITIGFAPVNDARKAREMQIARSWLWATPNKLRERNARKVAVNPIGEVSEAND